MATPQYKEIISRNPTIHWLVSTRPAVAGINAPRDSGTAATLGGGFMLDLVGEYRYIYMWNFVFNVLSLLVTLLIYRGWKRNGGAKSYHPPEYAS